MIRVVNFIYKSENDLLNAKESIGAYEAEQLLIQVFTYQTNIEKVTELRDEILNAFPGASIIGTSTAGEIFEGNAVEMTTTVSVMRFDQTKVKSQYINKLAQSPKVQEERARELSLNIASTDLKSLIIFSFGTRVGTSHVNVLSFLTELKRLNPNAVFAGGLAGVYNFKPSQLSVTFNENNVSNEGIALAGLYSEELHVFNKYNLSWVPIGKKLVIQEVDGTHLKMLDEQKPLEVYRTYLGDEIIDELPYSSTEFPMILERYGKQMIIHPEKIYDDGSMDMTHPLHAGEQLRFSYCHVGLLSSSANKIYRDLMNHDLQANFIYSCATRKKVLGEDISVELSPIAALSPTTGFFANGEFFDEGVEEYHRLGQTTTILGLREGAATNKNRKILGSFKDYTHSERSHFKTMRVLHKLVEKSVNDLEMISTSLADLAHKDALTGLFNRGYFDENLEKEIKRCSRSKLSLSLILMDIDYFKQYNDTYGHLAGDDVLRGVGQCLMHQVSRPYDVVTRYGGEEIAIILPDTNYNGASKLAEKLRQQIQLLKIPHKASKVSNFISASVGFVTIEFDDIFVDYTSAELIEECDRCLYDAKGGGRNKVVGKLIIQSFV